MRKTKMQTLSKHEIERAIERVGGLETLSDMLGLTSRQVRNYMRFQAAPKLAAEAIRSLGSSPPHDGAPPAQAGASQ